MQETYPDKDRKKNHRPGWMRVADITLRTVHIAVAGTLFGGFMLHVPFGQMHIWHGLTILTGCGLLALELLHSLNWPHQGRGILGIIHIGLSGFIHVRPDLVIPLLWIILVSGCVGSHMPKSYRHLSVLHRREVD
ncbi:MAG: hypothetical protein GYA56_08860 [Geobacteraceae bacterium]|nr:hypothetical protein [Geobacteraceae bacterium]